MAYRKHFIPLESNPETFNQLAHSLGLFESLEFQDVFTLDEPEFLPHPAYVLILVFPTDDNYEENRKILQRQKRGDVSVEDDEVLWFEQTINNACGLYAILHAVGNGEASKHISKDSILAKITDRDTPASIRTEIIESSEELEALYRDAATGGSSAVPTNAEDEVDYHYICLVSTSSGGKVYELDGDKASPVDTGVVLDEGEDMLGAKGIALVRKYLEKQENNIAFSLLALSLARHKQDV